MSKIIWKDIECLNSCSSCQLTSCQEMLVGVKADEIDGEVEFTYYTKEGDEIYESHYQYLRNTLGYWGVTGMKKEAQKILEKDVKEAYGEWQISQYEDRINWESQRNYF